MSLDILYVLSFRENYNKYISYVLKHTLDKETEVIISDLAEWYSSTTANEISWPAFAGWFRMVKHPMFKEDKQKIYQAIFSQMESYSPSEAVEGIIQSLLERSYAAQVADVALSVAEGTSPGRIGEIEELMRGYLEESGKAAENASEEVTDDIEEIISKMEGGEGLEWRLKCLNESLGPLRKGNFLVLGKRPEAGGCFAKGTGILMVNGSVLPVEEVKPGMAVMGPDSKARIVSGCYSGTEPMYRIQYSNGEYYDVNESHILSLKRSKSEGKHKNGDVLNVSVRDYLSWPDSRKQRYKGWKVGVEWAVPAPKGIPPYILGAWLGDGASSGARFTSMDEELIQEVIKYGLANDLSCKLVDATSSGNAITFSVTKTGKGSRGSVFVETLRKYNLVNNKHIPEDYLICSRKDRLELLAGLLDTDGNKNKFGYEFTNKNELLADQVMWLARSLGFNANKSSRICTRKCSVPTEHFRIAIYGDVHTIPVRIERKKFSKTNKKQKNKGLHFGFSIIPLGEGEWFGFQVDKDHLFLLSDFTVTHNTTFCASEATYMASQMKEGQQVLWFNNEQIGWEVKWRVFQAALAWNRERMERNKSVLRSEFEKSVGGEGRIKIFDVHGRNIHAIEEIIKRHNPGLIIFDQLWKVRGYEKSAGGDVQRLTAIFAKARDLAHEYAPVIAVHQADGSAAGEKYIPMESLYMSKTGCQGEADAIITLGVTYEPGLEYNRFINIPKNKLLGGKDSKEALRHGKFEVIIKPEIARFEE